MSTCLFARLKGFWWLMDLKKWMKPFDLDEMREDRQTSGNMVPACYMRCQCGPCILRYIHSKDDFPRASCVGVSNSCFIVAVCFSNLVSAGGFWSYDHTQSRQLQQNRQELDEPQEVIRQTMFFVCCSWLRLFFKYFPSSTVCQVGTRVFHP